MPSPLPSFPQVPRAAHAGGGKGCQDPSPSCKNALGSGINYSLGPGISTLQKQNDFKNLVWDRFLLKLSPADPDPTLSAGRGGCGAATRGTGPFESRKTLNRNQQLQTMVKERCRCSLPTSDELLSFLVEALQSSVQGEKRRRGCHVCPPQCGPDGCSVAPSHLPPKRISQLSAMCPPIPASGKHPSAPSCQQHPSALLCPGIRGE